MALDDPEPDELDPTDRGELPLEADPADVAEQREELPDYGDDR